MRTRYYNPNWNRFINADTVFSGNFYCYCYNNSIIAMDKDGLMPGKNYMIDICEGNCSQNNHLDIAFREDPHSILYDVPLYKQGSTNLCWAYAQLMVESFYSKVTLSQKEAKLAAKELGINRNGYDNWNSSGWPNNLGDRYIVKDINDILEALRQQEGPVYAYYEGKKNSHIVVVTGVDIDNDIVYTNNSWGIKGKQSFAQFSKGPAKRFYHFAENMVFRFLYLVKEEKE